MSAKTLKIVFLVATGLLTVIVLMFAGNSIFNNELFTARFASLGYPTYLIYPLSIANLLGLVIIWWKGPSLLKEWVYAGFFFNFLLALLAEFQAADGEYISSSLAIALLLTSYLAGKHLHKAKSII